MYERGGCSLFSFQVLCHVQGKTAYDVAMEAHNTFAMDTISMARSKTSPQGLWELITRQPVSTTKCVMGGALMMGGG